MRLLIEQGVPISTLLLFGKNPETLLLSEVSESLDFRVSMKKMWVFGLTDVRKVEGEVKNLRLD